MKTVLDFNHISKDLFDDDEEKFHDLYRMYHKLAKCYRMMYVNKKRKLLFTGVFSKILVKVGALVGGITLCPIVLGTISGAGVVMITYVDKLNLQKVTGKCRWAYTSYEKVLTEIRDYLRGAYYDKTKFLSNITKLDDMITDNCPPVTTTSKYEKKYN